MKRRRAFALVLSIFLVAMLATTGVGLALTAATESITAVWVARDLDHRLAVDSFLAFLPQLLKAQPTNSPWSSIMDDKRRFSLTLGDCHLQCEVKSEKEKLHIGSDSDQNLGYLREIARSRGLPEDNIKLRPILHSVGKTRLPKFVWFDQIVQPTEFEEVFRWVFPELDDHDTVKRKTWSDLISFWSDAGGTVLALEMETRIACDSRRWFVVVSIIGKDLEVLYRGGV